MLRFIFSLALSILPFGLVACDAPDEPTCSQDCNVTQPPVEAEPAEFGDGCENDSECINDDGNLVCSDGNCTIECESNDACSQFNFDLNGVTLAHACTKDDDSRLVCAPAY